MKSDSITRKYTVIDGRLISDYRNAKIVIYQKNLEQYYGAKPDHIDFYGSDSLENYKSTSYITNIFNCNKLYATTVNSKKQGAYLTIYAPFMELTSVANELAIYLLLEYHVLTLHAVGCLLEDKLIMFLGKSNSGKSTSAMLFKQMIPEAHILSDDFLCIRKSNNGLEFSVPIWDILADCSSQKLWRHAKSTFIVDLSDAHSTERFSDLANFAIGMDFCSDIAFSIYKELSEIERSIEAVHFLKVNRHNLWAASKEVVKQVLSIV